MKHDGQIKLFILLWYICFLVFSAPVLAETAEEDNIGNGQQTASPKVKKLRHVIFGNQSSPTSQAAVKALIQDWDNLPLEQYDKNWREPAFRERIQFTSAAVDLNRDNKEEVFVRLITDDKDVPICIGKSCLTFLMQMKNGRWERDKDAYLNIMISDSIDLLSRYSHGYADFLTDTFFAGKKYLYVYNGSSYGVDMDALDKTIAQITDTQKQSAEEKKKPGLPPLEDVKPSKGGKILHHLTFEKNTTPATQEAVAAFLKDWDKLSFALLEENWKDPAFKAKIKLTSAAVDLNRDNIAEVLVRLDIADEDSMICMTSNRVTLCQTYIMRFAHGQWKIMTDTPTLGTIQKINVLDSYHHGFADLSMAGSIFRYDGYSYTPHKVTDKEKFKFDEVSRHLIQEMLDNDSVLKKQGFSIRVVDVVNEIVFLNMYLGNQKIRKELVTNVDFDVMRSTSSTFNDKDLQDLKILRKSLSHIIEMDGIQLVQVRPGVPDGKIRLAEGSAVRQFSSASGKRTADLGFSISYNRLYRDDSGYPRADLVIEGEDKKVTGACGPYYPLIYKDMVLYFTEVTPREKFLITIKNKMSEQTFSSEIPWKKKISWKEDGSYLGIINLAREGNSIKKVKIWFSKDKKRSFWIELSKETIINTGSSSYTFVVSQTVEPMVDIFYNNSK